MTVVFGASSMIARYGLFAGFARLATSLVHHAAHLPRLRQHNGFDS